MSSSGSTAPRLRAPLGLTDPPTCADRSRVAACVAFCEMVSALMNSGRSKPWPPAEGRMPQRRSRRRARREQCWFAGWSQGEWRRAEMPLRSMIQSLAQQQPTLIWTSYLCFIPTPFFLALLCSTEILRSTIMSCSTSLPLCFHLQTPVALSYYSCSACHALSYMSMPSKFICYACLMCVNGVDWSLCCSHSFVQQWLNYLSMRNNGRKDMRSEDKALDSFWAGSSLLPLWWKTISSVQQTPWLWWTSPMLNTADKKFSLCSLQLSFFWNK